MRGSILKIFFVLCVLFSSTSVSMARMMPGGQGQIRDLTEKDVVDAVRIFLLDFILIQIFNKIDVQPTYMHKYSRSLSLVPHSLIHMIIRVISRTYVTLELQDQERKKVRQKSSVQSLGNELQLS